jgi:hypothetical protein
VPDNASTNDEFFVAYLPTPPRLRRLLIAASVALVILAGILALALAGAQRDPGPARWEQSASELVGVLRMTPYPFLEIPGENRAVLLVRSGKVGLGAMQAWDGQLVKTMGLRLERNGLMLLELADSAEAISPVTDTEPPASKSTVPQMQESVVLQGEIVDPKCFGGAMKPGDGKTHKACAVLCLRGGIPPTFVSESGEYLVMTDPQGHAFTGTSLETILPFVGDLVELSGQRFLENGLATLKLDPATIRRL